MVFTPAVCEIGTDKPVNAGNKNLHRV